MTKEIYVFNTQDKSRGTYLSGAIEDQDTGHREAYLDFYRPLGAKNRLGLALDAQALARLDDLEYQSVRYDRKIYVSGLKDVGTKLYQKNRWVEIEDKGDGVLVMTVMLDGVFYEDMYPQPHGKKNRYIAFINDEQAGLNAYSPLVQSSLSAVVAGL